MWPSVSCSHAPDNWMKLWSPWGLQTITVSAPVQFIDTPRQAWHMSSDISGQTHFQFILLPIWVGSEPHAATCPLAWSAPAHTPLTKTCVGHFSFLRMTFTGENSEERLWWDICALAMIVNASDYANIDSPCLLSDWGLFSWCTSVQCTWCGPGADHLLLVTWHGTWWPALPIRHQTKQTQHHSQWLGSFSHERGIFMKCK